MASGLCLLIVFGIAGCVPGYFDDTSAENALVTDDQGNMAPPRSGLFLLLLSLSSASLSAGASYGSPSSSSSSGRGN